MVSKMRVQRIAERMYEELSEMLIRDIQDPRLSGVSITDVKVDRELAYANIYVAALEGSERAGEVIDAFQHASGFIRSELAARINLRVFPRLRFHWDPTPEKAAHIEQLIASLHEESSHDAEDHPGPADETGPWDQNGPTDEEGGEDG